MGQAAIVHPQLAKASFARAIQLLTSSDAYEKLGIKCVGFSFPYLDVELAWRRHGTKLLLRVDGTDFPYRPVSGWWIALDGTPLLQGSNSVPSGAGFHTSGLDGEPRCWFCFKGWREYHNHSSHQDVSWASLRDNPRYSVPQLIAELHKELNGEGVVRV